LNIKKLPVLVTKERFMKRLMLSFLTVWMIFFSQHLFAQAADDANDATYNDGWQSGDNGGSGFGAWTLSPNPNNDFAGFFIGSSKVNGNGDSNNDNDINTGVNFDEAWALYAKPFNNSEAYRSLNSPLSVGQRFSIDMDNGFIESGAEVGFELRNTTSESLLRFYFKGGESVYKIEELSGTVSTSQGFTNEGLRIEIILTSTSNYRLVLTDLFDSSEEVINGSLKSTVSSQSFSILRLFNLGSAPNQLNTDQHNLFFNSLSVQTDANRPTVELANVSGTVANATLLDSKAGDFGIVRIEVKQLQDATLTVDSNAASLNDVITKQLVSSVPVSVTATGADPRVSLLVTDVAGNETVWFFDFLNM
ncbi:MAG: hypothetical protein KDH95_13490, partial [Calditrichaeota bacterium]|nr:hypothetical protein [Calditrichota bacterium]